ncbi:MAG: DUF373 family protein [Candidatus Aenigmarchaeota archaeon]|nr:DUF373 family protein [Candidatus Aenigmarchaeota archaeon]
MGESILIVCVDRDNDYGEKIGVKGPIFGREANLKAAQNLALEDPEESDANCLFGAVKEFDELKKRAEARDDKESIFDIWDVDEGQEEDKKTPAKINITTLLGDRNVGIISDNKITRQFEKAIKKYKPKKIVFVSDGAEDEHVLPIIQSRVPILSVKKVIVKQSSQLESGYYVILKFIKEIVHDPQTSRLMLGIPAIILILYALFGGLAWRFIMGIVGVYLIVKGFHLEKFISSFSHEMSSTLSKDKLSFFCYLLFASFIVVGAVQGYTIYTSDTHSNFVISLLSFVEGGLTYYLIAGVFGLTARLLHVFGRDRRELRFLTYYALLFSVYIVLENVIKYTIITDYSIYYLILSIIISFLILLIALITEKIVFSNG